jgi:glycosyltransferase involved in cell wall biosynthesis
MTTATHSRPRVLEVLYSFRIGGSELLGLELAKQLVDNGVEVMCTALDGMEGPLIERCKAYGITVVDLGLPLRSPLGRNGFSRSLVKRLKALRLDAIHLQHFLGLNKLGLPARLAGIPKIVVTEHSVLDVNQSFAGRFRIRLNWRLAHSITVIHSGIKDYLIDKLGVSANRVHVIPVGVDIDKWHCRDRSTCRARLSITSEFVFAFVGRLAPVKNIPGLIQAFLAVQETLQTKARLLIVGDGEDMAKCKSIVSLNPLGQSVTLVGEQSDTRPYLAAADAFIMNSKSEGTPRALLEAMAMGLASICPAVGGIPAILSGRGWLTDSTSPSTLQSAMTEAIGDREKVNNFGALSKDFVTANYNSAAIVSRYRELILN